MKFLIDNQLPQALARFISQELGAEALHVSDVNLRDASDAKLWAYASKNDLILISKDEDFLNLFSKDPAARLLWVRLANCRRAYLLDVFRQLWPSIVKRFANGDLFVELR